MAIDKSNSQQETNYLLASQANREALQHGLDSNCPVKTFTPVEWDEFLDNNLQSVSGSNQIPPK